MIYKYIIRKIETNNGVKYVPHIWNKDNWKYLILHEETYMVSRKTRVEYDKLIDAYRFIASHRMEKGMKGKDRPKCLFFKDAIAMIPLIGIFYTLPKILKKIPMKYLYTNPINFAISVGVQLTTLMTLLIMIF